MALKILRLIHIHEIQDALRRVIDLLSEIFFMQRYFLTNLYKWIIAAVKFLLSLHYFACGWIMIDLYKSRRGLPHAPFSGDTAFSMYVDSIYFMTSITSTVGYGDFKGYIDDEGHWTAEMVYLIFITLSGILLFASVTD
jgi:hypothetical protein